MFCGTTLYRIAAITSASAEARVLDKVPRGGRSSQIRPLDRSPIPFPESVAVGLLLVVALGLLSSPDDDGTRGAIVPPALLQLLVSMGFVGAVLFTAQLYLLSRRVRYAIVITVITILITLASGVIVSQVVGSSRIAIFILGTLVLLILVLAPSVAAWAVFRQLYRRLELDRTPAPRVRWTYRLVVSSTQAILVIVFLTVGFGVVVVVPWLLFRYQAMNLMSAYPVLYLRSFKNYHGAAAFQTVVSRVIPRYAVVEAVAHRNQPALAIQDPADWGQQGSFFSMPDLEWQARILEKLDRAVAVIVDVTERSEGLDWELDQARRLLPSDRIVLLQFSNARSSETQTDGVLTIEYGRDDGALRQARRELRSWAKRALR